MRQLAILQVGYVTRSIYEYSHHIRISREFGVSDADIRAIADKTQGRATGLDRLAKAVLRAAREMTSTLEISLLPPPLLHRPPLLYPAWNRADQPNPFFLYVVLCAVLGLTAAGLAFLYLRFLFRGSAGDGTDMIEEERTSLWSWQLFRDQLRGLWAALFGHFQNGRQVLAGWSMTARASRAGEPDPADIREIYRRLLRWAAARGHRRQPATTPRELWRQISTAVPRASNAFALITANYERARYGDLEATGPDLAASRAASDEITTANNQDAAARSHR